MKLSTKGRYAMVALVDIALQPEGSLTSLAELSRRQSISLPYLEQLFVKLRRGHIVQSVRGPGGGYVLARPAGEIRVDEIIDSVEETLVPVSCMDDDGSCACNDQCVTHSVWQGLGERIRTFLSSITLEDLTTEAQDKLSDRLAL